MTDTYDPSLLPPPDAAERCAAHADRIGLDPGGTALWLDEMIVVDVPLPWPKPVWAKDGFTHVPELVMAAGDAGRRVRVLAATPLADGGGRVIAHRLGGGASFERAEHRVEPGDTIELLTTLLADGLDASDATVVDTAPQRELLLCTQGSHDVCCGSRGVALEAELLADGWTSIRRVSHTGGHRMAPTGLTLPDGRMWGRVGPAEMLGILRRTMQPAAVARYCRGWVGAAPGVGQMAERAVFADVDDWTFDEEPRVVEVDGGRAVVTSPRGTWTVRVEAARAVPTIACGQPGGLPAKPGTEWVVRSITREA